MIIFCIAFLTQPKNTIALCSEKLKLSIFMAAPNWFIGISVWIHLLLIVFTLSWLKISIIVAYTDHLNKKNCLNSSWGITKIKLSLYFVYINCVQSLILKHRWNDHVNLKTEATWHVKSHSIRFALFCIWKLNVK